MRWLLIGWFTLGIAGPLAAYPAAEHADQADYPFSRIRTGRESANFDVRCILRDSDGYVWFGTSFGLLRYDGAQTIMLGGENDAPLNAYINSIQEDAEGQLWVRVDNESFFVYNRRTHRSRTDVDALLSEELGRPVVLHNLHIDAEKNRWIFTSEGLGCIDGTTGRYTAARIGEPFAELPAALTRSGDWCCLLHASGAVDVVDVQTMQLKRKIPPPQNLAHTADNQGFLKIFADSHGCVWITDSYNGVWRCAIEAGSWERFSEQEGHRISNNSVLDLTEESGGRIWIATDHGGINIYDPQNGRITLLEYDSYDPNTLASNSVYSLYRDAEQNIWAGHYKHGISLFSPARRNYFMHHIRRLLDHNRHDDINSVCEDRAGNLWFGTNEFGAVRLDRTTGEERFFHSGSGPEGIGSDVVVSLFCDTRGRVWIGTYQGGLSCWEGGRMHHYRHREGQPRSLADDSVWDIVEDCDGHIWIATMSGGVQRLDPATNDFDSFTADGSGILSNYVLDIACERGRELYVSTVNGIVAIDVRTLACRQLLTGIDLKMLHLCRDSRGLLWIVDRFGALSLYDTNQAKFVPLDRAAMPTAVRSIIEGDDKTLWIATDNGIYHLRVEPDPATGDYRFSVYGYRQQEKQRESGYNFRSAARTSRGEILFGSINGYSITDPADVCFEAERLAAHRVRFTALTINQTEILPGTAYEGREVLREDIGFTDRIDLQYRQNRFSLTFAPMEFSSPFHTEYRYQLEGFSDEWLPVTGEQHEVAFTNLMPGQYRLRIRAAHADGATGSAEVDAATLIVAIHPPIWRTTVAWVLYALLFAAAVCTAILLLLRRQRRRLEQRQARIEAERQNRLNEMKIAFFTNISHDFRTPLSLILSPLAELRNRSSAGDRNLIETIYRNAQRLLQLVNQLLDFRKLDANGMTLHRSHGNLIAFVQEICSSFELLTEESHVSLETEFSTDRLECDFDKDKLSKIVMNLLSNAFKYTRGAGSVRVVVTADEAAGRVAIEVRDTGIGIPDSDKERIFDRFYQVDRPDAGTGSGLGLHIVREFAVLHGGSVRVTDNTPCGSIFRVELPICRTSAAADTPALPAEAPTEREEASPHASDRSVILIVEDNADFRKFMCDCFRTEYDVLEAEDGVAALELLQHSSVDIIVSDVMMPRMDGVTLCRRLKSDLATSHIPLILLTARSMEEHEIEGLSGGADDYIVKPVNISVLRLRIVRLLKWTHQSRERFSADPQIHPSEITITSLDERLIEQARDIVLEHIGKSDFSVEELSSRLGMHRTHLYKKLTFITGKSPLEFIRIIRLKRAAELLSSGNRINVSEVAYMVGFNSPKLFARYFREVYACSPREYQRTASPGDSV